MKSAVFAALVLLALDCLVHPVYAQAEPVEQPLAAGPEVVGSARGIKVRGDLETSRPWAAAGVAGSAIIRIVPHGIVPGEAVQELIRALEESSLDRRKKRPLQVSLLAALGSIERGQINAAINQLKAFQNKCRAQVTRIDPQLAEGLIGAAQEIIAALALLEPEPGPIPNMVWIPAGTFLMGSPTSEAERSEREVQHEVTISRGFWMGKYEVTQLEYVEVVGSNPSFFRNGRPSYPSGTGGPVTNELLHPVEQVDWFEATNYCELLTERERAAHRLPESYAYRLPTEAEWEYACRAGATTAFHYGDELRSGMANFHGRLEYDAVVGISVNPAGVYLGRTTEVGSYEPNAWGLYDMHGNVYEWCQDWDGAYPLGPGIDPAGPETGSSRVFRGGIWQNMGGLCRSARRMATVPGREFNFLGFRAVLAPVRP